MFSGFTRFVYEGDEGGVRRILERSTPVDVIGDGRIDATPLQAASMAGHREGVELLLARGADVNHVDRDGCSQVTSAAYARYWSEV